MIRNSLQLVQVRVYLILQAHLMRSRHQHQHSGYAPHPLLHNLNESFLQGFDEDVSLHAHIKFSAEHVDTKDGLFQSSYIYLTRGTSGSTLMGRGYVPIKTLVPS